MLFKLKGESIIVAVPILEVYLPEDYPSVGLYSIVGSNTKWYGVANYKTFKNESQLEHRENVPTYPLGISSFILSRPSEMDTDTVQFTKNGEGRKCVIMRFYANDVFAVDRNLIKSADNITVLMNRLESGKLDNIPPSIVLDIVDHGQEINNINLKLPPEHLDAMIAERYRDPNNKSKKLRFSKGGTDKVVSVTPREDAMTSTTFQAFTFEDVNSSLVVACNRKAAGVHEDPTLMEKIIRGEKIDNQQP